MGGGIAAVFLIEWAEVFPGFADGWGLVFGAAVGGFDAGVFDVDLSGELFEGGVGGPFDGSEILPEIEGFAVDDCGDFSC